MVIGNTTGAAGGGRPFCRSIEEYSRERKTKKQKREGKSMNMNLRKGMACLLAVLLLGAAIVAAEETAGILCLPAALQVIEEEAFCGDTALEKVIVPEGVTEIQARAFAGSSLTEIVLPASLTTIAEDAFDGCGFFVFTAQEGTYAHEWGMAHGCFNTPADCFLYESMGTDNLMITDYTGAYSDVVIPGEIDGKKVTGIDYEAFYDKGLKSVIIPDSVTYIGKEAFAMNGELTQISLPAALSQIENGAFSQCDLAAVVLPEGLEAIGTRVFYGNENLKAIHIPASVESIQGGAFAGLPGLTSFTLAEGNEDYVIEDGVLFTADKNLLMMWLPGKTDTEYAVPETVRYIEEYAFNGVNSLEKVTVPQGVYNIDDAAFRNCRALKEVIIPASCEYIGNYAFAGCTSLTEMALDVMEYDAINIEPGTFEGCTSLKRVSLPYHVYFIYDDAFKGCAALESIGLHGRIKWIADTAFDGCEKLVAAVEENCYAHQWCVANNIAVDVQKADTAPAELFAFTEKEDGTLMITNYIEGEEIVEVLVIPSSVDGVAVTEIGECAFEETEYIRNVTIPGSVKTIGPGAFMGCYHLERVAMEAGVETICQLAFSECNALSHVHLPGSVKTIGGNAFEYCDSLVEITIPEGVETIEDGAFSTSIHLTKVTLPASLKEIGNDAFENCTCVMVLAQEGTYAHTWAKEQGLLPEEAVLESAHPYGNNLNKIWYYQHEEDAYCLRVTFSRRTYVEDSCDYLFVTDSQGNTVDYTADALAGAALVLPGNHFSVGIESDWSIGSFGFAVTKVEAFTEENVAAVLYETETLADGTLKIVGAVKLQNELVLPSQIGGKAVTVIGKEALAYMDITSVVVPEGIVALEEQAFAYCDDLQQVSLPASLTAIADDVFSESNNVIVEAPEGSYAYQWADENNYIFREALIESDHPYANNEEKTWAYTHPQEAEALRVVFSRNTRFESGYDSLTVIASDGTEIRYSGTQLTGKEIFLPGNTFSLRLKTDESQTYYGFAVVAIEAASQGEYENFVLGSAFATHELEDGTLQIVGYTGTLENVNVPARINGKAVTSIGEEAFYNADMLKTLVLPEGITHIAENAFGDCGKLGRVTLPASLETIAGDAFDGSNYAEIIAPENSYAYTWAKESGLLLEEAVLESAHPYGNNEEETWQYTHPQEAAALRVTFSAKTSFEDGPDFLTVIDNQGEENRYSGNALKGRSIVLPGNSFSLRLKTDGSVIRFGFRITNVQAVTEEEYEEYQRAHVYDTVLLDDGTLKIVGYKDAVNVEETVTLPQYIDGIPVTAVGEDAFESAKWTGVVIPEGYVSIDNFAFLYCYNLTSIALPDSLISIGNRTLSNINLYTITVGENNQAYCVEDGVLFTKDKKALVRCVAGKTGDYTVPETVTELWYGAFYECAQLTGITLPQGLTKMGDLPFYRCAQLKSIAIPSGVKELSYYAFLGCKNLTEVQLAEGLEYIGDEAFRECDALTSITIPASVTRLSNGIYSGNDSKKAADVFDMAYALEAIHVAEGNTVYSSQNGVLMSKDGTTLIRWPSGKAGACTVPSTVTAIGPEAFKDAEGLTAVILPEGVVSIGRRGFDGCSGLTALNLPSTVRTIGQAAFNGCELLKEVTVPEGVTAIEGWTFGWCTALRRVNLPASVTTIDESAFNSTQAEIVAPEGSYAWQWAVDNGRLAEEAVLESDHPYANNEDKTWEYTHPRAAVALRLTFSQKTELESGWDYLYITDAAGNEMRYTGTELAGKTVVLEGDSFTLRLTSDTSGSLFGFRLLTVTGLGEETTAAQQ